MEKKKEKVAVIKGPLPGDKIARPPRKRKARGLRRVLGVPALYSMAYGDVGSSIYYALGITAFYALGATPIALGIAGIFFIFTALTYAEGTAMIPESGGSSAFARRGFNELVSFLSGWSLVLVYIATIAISAISASFYLSHFFPVLKAVPLAGALGGMGIIFFLMLLNIIGVKETANFNIIFIVFDLLTQIILVIIGFILLFNLKKLLGYIDWSGSSTWPKLSMMPYAISVGMVGYMGLETVTQMAEETRTPERKIPLSLMLAVVTVMVMFLSIPVVALSAMHPQELKMVWHEDPISGIAHYLPNISIVRGEHFSLSLSLSKIMTPWVATIATTILVIACNAGLTAASRVIFSMAGHRQLPPLICQLHKRFRTPYVGIVLFSVVAILLLIPGCYKKGILLILGDLYRFGGMLAFSLAHISIIALRIKEPETKRPFRCPGNFKIRNKEIPITAIIGFLSTFSVWVVILIYNPWGRNIGFTWLVIGLIIYITYRLKNKLPILGKKAENKDSPQSTVNSP